MGSQDHSAQLCAIIIIFFFFNVEKDLIAF